MGVEDALHQTEPGLSHIPHEDDVFAWALWWEPGLQQRAWDAFVELCLGGLIMGAAEHGERSC